MNFLTRTKLATIAAYRTFKRTYADPSRVHIADEHATRVGHYDHLWALYTNSVFEDSARWQRYRAEYGLYRYTRALYNPTKRLVNFYAGVIYPGVLTIDAEQLPDGTPIAIPLSEDADDVLRDAIGQLWQWANWQSGKGLYVRYGAALGSVPVEIVDDISRGKILFDVLWPGHIPDIEIDNQGNVKSYAVEYRATDDRDQEYTYRKEVDGDAFRYYRDDDLIAEDENPYGFAPLVWAKHTDVGGDFGEPALRGIGKLDEVNELASHKHDRGHAVLSAPILASGEGVGPLESGNQTGPTVEASTTQPKLGREKVNLLKSNGPGSLSTVELPQGEVGADIARLLSEIEADHPELNMYEQLRSMSQVTGPAAGRLVGDTATLVEDARANYDMQSIKLFQMGTAVGGWRASSGAWGRALTPQQRKFAPFDLESYARGELDLAILPRELVPLTALERIQIEEARLALELQRTALGAGEGALAA